MSIEEPWEKALFVAKNEFFVAKRIKKVSLAIKIHTAYGNLRMKMEWLREICVICVEIM